MINVCAHCRLYRAGKIVSAATGNVAGPCRANLDGLGRELPSATATCPHCGHALPFLRLPLRLIGGASATGKSAILQLLAGRFTAAVLLEADLLWQEEFNPPADGQRRFFETWLRLAKIIGQSGRPVALCGTGFAVPENIEPCLERRDFSQVHYLALSCAADLLHDRLEARPAWRNSSHPAPLQQQLAFNHWLQQEGPLQDPPLTRLDTTGGCVADSARAVSKRMPPIVAAQTPPADR